MHIANSRGRSIRVADKTLQGLTLTEALCLSEGARKPFLTVIYANGGNCLTCETSVEYTDDLRPRRAATAHRGGISRLHSMVLGVLPAP